MMQPSGLAKYAVLGEFPDCDFATPDMRSVPVEHQEWRVNVRRVSVSARRGFRKLFIAK